MAIFLFSLGVYILARFSFRRRQTPVALRPISARFLSVGLVAGSLDAMGGSGWSPISTPTLLSSGRMEPRKIIRTVDTSEFLVALVTLAASIGFLILLSSSSELLGGVIVAPVADYIVRIMPACILGTAVGSVILISNCRRFSRPSA